MYKGRSNQYCSYLMMPKYERSSLYIWQQKRKYKQKTAQKENLSVFPSRYKTHSHFLNVIYFVSPFAITRWNAGSIFTYGWFPLFFFFFTSHSLFFLLIFPNADAFYEGDTYSVAVSSWIWWRCHAHCHILCETWYIRKYNKRDKNIYLHCVLFSFHIGIVGSFLEWDSFCFVFL